MRITESQLRQVVKRLIAEQTYPSGNAKGRPGVSIVPNHRGPPPGSPPEDEFDTCMNCGKEKDSSELDDDEFCPSCSKCYEAEHDAYFP